jgi:tetratricopeptide (TPR) repeat protein
MRKSLPRLFLIILMLLSSSLSLASPSTQEYAKANKMFAVGNYSDAIFVYQSMLSSPSGDVSHGVLHTRIGDSYFQQGKYRKALEAYRLALKKQEPSERAQTQYWIGLCTLLLGRNAEAVTEFLKIPGSYPASGMWVGTAYYWAGRASDRMGNKEQAAEYYRKAGGKGKSAQERFAMKKAEGVENGSTK